MLTPRSVLRCAARRSLATALIAGGCVPGLALAAPPSTSPSPRSPLRVEAPEVRCSEIEGAYVALLDPGRGMLLLSGAPFPGGTAAGAAHGGPMTVRLAQRHGWQLAKVGMASSPTTLWAAHYGFRGEPVRGCVAFDKDRFSAAGDLASYVHWLVDGVYARLPAAERERRPAFRLSDRRVRLRVTRPGAGAVELSGKEGGTLACRFSDGERIYLLIPFVLDQALERVAVDVGYTDRPYWEAAEKTMTGFAVAEPGSPAEVTDPGLEVALLDVAPSIGQH